MALTRPLIQATAFFEGLVYTNHLLLPRLRILRMWKPRKSNPSSMWTTRARSTPGVCAPAFPATRCHATTRNAGSQTRLYRSSNRRPGSPAAQPCSLACILRTVTCAQSCSGQMTAPVFTGASSNITVLLAPLAAALPQVTGSPGLGVLRRLRPTRTLQPATDLSPPVMRHGGEWTADGSHVHCVSVNGRGARLCPCVLVVATP